ncbi:acyl-CoA-binding domain-containing protein 5-like isoform X2 [Dysidea avara]|uniref:acyl-CoA-binding domain-containing protein 5-like isoform X2 n=1 Tax=Dysidea avara TaxID=196820 RepID=UPI003328C2BA
MASLEDRPSRRPRDIQTRFNKAVSVIQSLPKDGPFQPSNMLKLKFYAFYKQATVGPCNAAKPGFWDVTGRAKWEAWNMAGNMPKEEAMRNYIEELQKIVETMPQSKEVEDFLKSIGPFYEEVDETSKPHTNPTLDRASVHTEGDSTVAADIKEGLSDSEDEIFSDPIATPESSSMKSPVIDSLSEGSDEFLLVGDSQTTITGGNTKNEPVSSDQVDHQGDTVVELPLSDDGEEQPVSSGGGQQSQKDVLVSRQLDQVRRDLQSILHRLNSLEVLLQRRRALQSRWWPFSDLSWPTLVVLILWPILVNLMWRKLRRSK